ncbi:hypothetical protein LP092_15130 (plasmid) [Moraxella bovis]|uniref:DUF4340 domain-containing protein n=1 Tax=Moraxella bovis TaxID=476 RepID=A0ABY6MBZ4_MORBO|nr:hypothetical protein [Moraxella bovis]UZA04809.1 hypothetical protein LP092_15130 [Moraxella bovis]
MTDTTNNTSNTNTTKSKQSYPKKQPNYMLWGGIIAGSFLLIVIITYFVLVSSAKKQRLAAQAAAEAQAAETQNMQQHTQSPVYLDYFKNNPEGWYFKSNPLEHLVMNTIENSIASSQYNAIEMLKAPNGAELRFGTPEYNMFIQDIQTQTLNNLNSKYRTENKNGYGFLYKKDINGEYILITDPQDITEIEENTAHFINGLITAKITQLPAPAPAEVVEQTPPLSDVQKQRYETLIEKQKSWNQDLRRENKELKEKIAQTENQVHQILQKLEDSPNANQALKATMMPASTNVKVQAVMGGKAWVKDKNGKLHILEVGSILPDSALRIAEIQENTGLVMVTPR